MGKKVPVEIDDGVGADTTFELKSDRSENVISKLIQSVEMVEKLNHYQKQFLLLQ